jgi:hypothetical protein
MKASEITLNKQETCIQIPNCDATQVIFNQFGLQQFISAFGDVEVVLDFENDFRQEFSVPDFAESRGNYIQRKSAECDKWGSE